MANEETIEVVRYVDVYPKMDPKSVFFIQVEGQEKLSEDRKKRGWKRYLVKMRLKVPALPVDGVVEPESIEEIE